MGGNWLRETGHLSSFLVRTLLMLISSSCGIILAEIKRLVYGFGL